MTSTLQKLPLLLLLACLTSFCSGFYAVTPITSSLQQQQQQHTHLHMSTGIEPKIGSTEQLLLDVNRRREQGLVQRLGKTVKKDGLDDVRAAVWALFNISNIVFPVLGAALVAGLALNVAGYGYHFEGHALIIQTWDQIHQDAFFATESTRLMQ